MQFVNRDKNPNPKHGHSNPPATLNLRPQLVNSSPSNHNACPSTKVTSLEKKKYVLNLLCRPNSQPPGWQGCAAFAARRVWVVGSRPGSLAVAVRTLKAWQSLFGQYLCNDILHPHFSLVSDRCCPLPTVQLCSVLPEPRCQNPPP